MFGNNQTTNLAGIATGIRRLLAGLILLSYPIAALYPFHWESPFARNLAETMPGGVIRFSAPGIAKTTGPPEWVTDAIRLNQLEISLSVRSYSPNQLGPGRIMSLSSDPWHRNLTIGQTRDDLIFRVRTPATDINGLPSTTISNVFRASDWIDLQITIQPRWLLITVDSVVKFKHPLPEAPFQTWDSSYELALGNELTGDRPWLGEIRRAIVRVGHTNTDYLIPCKLEIPKMIRYFHNTPRLTPFGDVELNDAFVNLIGFVPLGILLGVWQLKRTQRLNWSPMLIIATLSVTLESLQIGIPQRYLSVDDIILNCLGGATGLLLAHISTHSQLLNSRHHSQR